MSSKMFHKNITSKEKCENINISWKVSFYKSNKRGTKSNYFKSFSSAINDLKYGTQDLIQ